jgi:hypothetical protein
MKLQTVAAIGREVVTVAEVEVVSLEVEVRETCSLRLQRIGVSVP